MFFFRSPTRTPILLVLLLGALTMIPFLFVCPCVSFLQQTRFQQMSDSIIGRIDEMGSRIDDLEKSIGDLIQQAGLDEFDMASKPPTTT